MNHPPPHSENEKYREMCLMAGHCSLISRHPGGDTCPNSSALPKKDIKALRRRSEPWKVSDIKIWKRIVKQKNPSWIFNTSLQRRSDGNKCWGLVICSLEKKKNKKLRLKTRLKLSPVSFLRWVATHTQLKRWLRPFESKQGKSQRISNQKELARS